MEGVEDALSVRMAVQEPVAATLGIDNIGKAKLPARQAGHRRARWQSRRPPGR